MQSWTFSIIAPVSRDSSEIILICWFADQETFMIIVNAKNNCVTQLHEKFCALWNKFFSLCCRIPGGMGLWPYCQKPNQCFSSTLGPGDLKKSHICVFNHYILTLLHYSMKKSRSTWLWIPLIWCEGELLIFKCVMTEYSRLSFGILRLWTKSYLCAYIVSVLFKARHYTGKYTLKNKGSKRVFLQWCHRRTISGSPKKWAVPKRTILKNILKI